MWPLFKNDSKRLVNILVLLSGFYFLGYLLSGFSNSNATIFPQAIFYSICSVAIFVVVLINFKYLHEKTSATHILSLPLTKVQICLTKYLNGLCVIIIPSIGFIIALGFTTNINIAQFIASALSFICIYYTLGCVVVNLTGKSVMHIFVYVMICFIPMLLYISLSTTIAQYVYGMSNPDISIQVVYLLLPGSYLVQNTVSLFYTLLFIGYSVGLFILMVWIANVRPFEKTGEAVAFDKVDDIIKFLIIASISWLLMALIASTLYEGKSLLPTICIFSTVIVTIIVELIFFKKVKILRALIQIVSVCVVTIVIYFGTSNYFQYRIPSTPKEVAISFEGYAYGNTVMKSEDESVIVMIQEVHKYLTTAPIMTQDMQSVIQIRYLENNGDSITRTYDIDKNGYYEVKAILNKHMDAYVTLMGGYYDAIEKEISQESITGITYILEQQDTLELDKQNMQLFKQKLKIQVQRFKEHPELYQEINFFSGRDKAQIYLQKETDENYYYEYFSYKNDPIYYALLDFKAELKAN